MACPFFEPRHLLPPGLWTHRPRLPLGDAYSGLCHAAGNPHAPPEEHQRELCNRGYARGVCAHFPASSLADAVRFSVTREQPLRLVYILEKDHSPLEYGELDAAAPARNEILAAQARAFAASYRRLTKQGR